jgi:cytochrome c-type biogenesis protein
LAVLLGWISTSGNPVVGVLLLTSFGVGQVLPLMIAGSAAASVPKLLALRPIGRWVPPLSGAVLICTGMLSLLARLT